MQLILFWHVGLEGGGVALGARRLKSVTISI